MTPFVIASICITLRTSIGTSILVHTDIVEHQEMTDSENLSLRRNRIMHTTEKMAGIYIVTINYK